MNKTENIGYNFQMNNKNRSAGYFACYVVSGAVFLAAIFVFIFLNLNIPLLITIASAVIYFILFHLLKPSYVELLVTDERLIVNYYSVATALKSYQTIEIELAVFHGFEIRRKYRGFVKQLVLTVKSKFGLADYPPISVSILTRKELNQLVVVLSKLAENKN